MLSAFFSSFSSPLAASKTTAVATRGETIEEAREAQKSSQPSVSPVLPTKLEEVPQSHSDSHCSTFAPAKPLNCESPKRAQRKPSSRKVIAPVGNLRIPAVTKAIPRNGATKPGLPSKIAISTPSPVRARVAKDNTREEAIVLYKTFSEDICSYIDFIKAQDALDHRANAKIEAIIVPSMKKMRNYFAIANEALQIPAHMPMVKDLIYHLYQFQKCISARKDIDETLYFQISSYRGMQIPSH